MKEETKKGLIQYFGIVNVLFGFMFIGFSLQVLFSDMEISRYGYAFLAFLSGYCVALLGGKMLASHGMIKNKKLEDFLRG